MEAEHSALCLVCFCLRVSRKKKKQNQFKTSVLALQMGGLLVCPRAALSKMGSSFRAVSTTETRPACWISITI